jgi:hypothetical protein
MYYFRKQQDNQEKISLWWNLSHWLGQLAWGWVGPDSESSAAHVVPTTSSKATIPCEQAAATKHASCKKHKVPQEDKGLQCHCHYHPSLARVQGRHPLPAESAHCSLNHKANLKATENINVQAGLHGTANPLLVLANGWEGLCQLLFVVKTLV